MVIGNAARHIGALICAHTELNCSRTVHVRVVLPCVVGPGVCPPAKPRSRRAAVARSRPVVRNVPLAASVSNLFRAQTTVAAGSIVGMHRVNSTGVVTSSPLQLGYARAGPTAEWSPGACRSRGPGLGGELG